MAVKAVLAIVAAAISAAGAIQQGNAAKRSADFEADQLRAQAARDREIAGRDAEDYTRQESRRRARFRALQAGSGTTLEGTPLAVLGDLAAEAEYQALRIRAGGETQASRAESSANIREFEGRAARQAGFTQAGTSLLAGASRFGSSGGGKKLPAAAPT